MKIEAEIPDWDIQEVVATKVAETMTNQMDSEFRKKLGSMVHQSVKETIAELTKQTLEGSIIRTNQWGEAMMEPVPFRDMLLKEVNEFLKASSGRDYHGNRTLTKFQKLLEEVVEDIFKKELKTKLEEAAKEARKLLDGKFSEAVAETVKRLNKGYKPEILFPLTSLEGSNG